MRLFLLVAILLSCISLHAKNYYFSNAGSDSWDGSQAKPWKTLTKASKTGASGDYVLFRAGETFTGTLKARAGVTYDCWGDGVFTIFSGTANGFVASSISNVTLRNCVVLGTYMIPSDSVIRPAHHGVLFQQSGGTLVKSVTAENVTIKNFGGCGLAAISTKSTLATAIDGVNFIGCDVSNVGLHGIFTSGTWPKINCANVLIKESVAHDCKGGAITNNHSGNGIFLSCTLNGVIDRCGTWNNGELNKSSNGPIGQWCADSRNLIFQYGYSYNNKTGPGQSDGGGYDAENSVNIVFQSCASENNMGAGFGLYQYNAGANQNPMSKIFLYDCRSINDGRSSKGYGAITFWSAITTPVDGITIKNFVASYAPKGYFIRNFGNGQYFTNVLIDSSTVCKTPTSLGLGSWPSTYKVTNTVLACPGY